MTTRWARALVLYMAGAGLMTTGGQADTVYRYIASQETVDLRTERVTATSGEMTVWIGDDRARLDRPDETVIYRGDTNTLYWVDHGTKTYQQVTTPYALRDVVPVEKRLFVSSAERSFSSFANVSSKDGGMMDRWPTTLTTVEARRPKADARFSVESWMTTSLGLTTAPYQSLQRWDAELNPFLRSWFSAVSGLEGVVVRRRLTYETPSHRQNVTSQLLDVERDQAVADGHYAPPADYQSVPLDGTRRFLPTNL